MQLNGNKSLIAGAAALLVLGLKQIGIDIPAENIVDVIICIGGLIGFGHKVIKKVKE